MLQRLAILMIGAALLCGFASGSFGQGKKPYEKHDTSALYNSLRDVINTGAKLYNDSGDHAGCFRLYQGSLLSVKPFLAPDLQKKIDDTLAGCDKLNSYADRSFELRKVLDEIRAKVKPAGSEEDGQVSGTITYLGKPIGGGFSVILVSAKETRITTIVADGKFTFKEPIPVGEYRVAIVPNADAKPGAFPARYGSETTSGLTVSVQKGKTKVDLDLVK